MPNPVPDLPDPVPLHADEVTRPPATGQVAALRAADGVVLRYAHWRPTGKRNPRGTVLIVQGRAEYIERYYEVIGELRQRGFHVVAFDWRGQGGSQRLTANRRKGYVRRFADYRLDLAAICEGPMARLPRPHFGLSHSMGGAICLDAAARKVLPIDRLVTVAPMLGISLVPHETRAHWLANLGCWLGFGRSFVPGGGETASTTKPFAGNRLSRDPERYALSAHLAGVASHLTLGDPTLRWASEAFRLMARLANPEVPLSITMPTMVIAAGDDPVVSMPAVLRFGARLKTGQALIIPGARHEILHETDAVRQQFWAAFDAFIPGERELIEIATAAQPAA